MKICVNNNYFSLLPVLVFILITNVAEEVRAQLSPTSFGEVPASFSSDSNAELARLKELAKSKVFNLTVGVVVSDRTLIQNFLLPFFEEINNETPVASRPTVRLTPIFDQPDLPTKSANPIEAVLKICERFVQQGIGALILRNENKDLMTPVAISYTLSFYQIPIISINDRNNIFSDKSIHSMFMRTVPAYSEQALVMLDVVNHFGWTRVSVLATNDVNGRNFLSNLWPAIQRRNIKVEPYYPFEPGNSFLIRFHLQNLAKSATRVALIYGSKEDCLTVAMEAQRANLSSSFVWIFNDLVISEMSSVSTALNYIPQGAIIPRLKHLDDTEAHLMDAIRAVKYSYQSMIKKTQTAKLASERASATPGDASGTMSFDRSTSRSALSQNDLLNLKLATFGDPAPTPKECGGEGAHWADGQKYLKELKMFKQNPAETGDLAFNTESGDRLNSEYEILNLRTSSPYLVPVATWTSATGLVPNPDEKVIWPGGSTVKPQGVVVSKHLKIVTAVTEPFVNKMRAFPNRKCDNILKNQADVPRDAHAVPCSLPTFGDRNETEYWCCYGYCIDLLVKLAEQLKISYELHLVADGKFGARASKSTLTSANFVPTGQVSGSGNNGSPGRGPPMEKEVWDGTIGDVLTGQADLIVAALTIDNERAQVIDFSNPFKHQGLSIVVKKKPPNSSLASFIQPFQYQLWVLIALSVHVVALILYLLDRFSPFGRFKVDYEDGSVEEEDALNLSSAMWFAWGVLLNSGIGEGTPRSFSARVLGVVWAGFAMIIVASYTANLAAFLVLDRPEAEIAGINDARMRNPSEAYKYGTVRNSAVQAYFKRKVEMSNMYRFMLKYSKDSAQEAIEHVRNGDLDAFIWDSAVLDYETSRDCSLVTVGEMFHRSGYGIGMAKDSAWKEQISLEVLQFHEDGFMETLDNKWMKLKTCDNSDSQPATLGLENMAGVFMLVGGGIVAGVMLIFIEMAYKRHYGKQEREEVVARAAFDRWRSAVKNKSRGNGDGVSYVPSTYNMGTQPSESKLNQLFGSQAASSSYIPMHTMSASMSQPSSLSRPNDLCSPEHVPRAASNLNGPSVNIHYNPSSMLRHSHPTSPPAPPPRTSQLGTDYESTLSNSGTDSPSKSGVAPYTHNPAPLLPSNNVGAKPKQHKLSNNKAPTPKQTLQSQSQTNKQPTQCNSSSNATDSSLSSVTLDLKLFDPDFVREKSSAGRISAKSSRGDLHLT